MNFDNFLNFQLVYFNTLDFYVLFAQPNLSIFKNYDCFDTSQFFFSQFVDFDKLVLVNPNDDFLQVIKTASFDVVMMDFKK